ncbi:hypothetical protein [Bowmanella sp. JS7-9]|uniref:Uncharacterized protein n=1 Tax=Pseudobowmanella zhangzhouensis TaxID=1537679 RepID=A0ABW1XL87_9ALTE|nr:hypothetical protein [Bowmanella sp. JS7-9]TBX23174.1 hypothetical protein TK45_08170 [Bowmanella sp. JS7-9]
MGLSAILFAVDVLISTAFIWLASRLSYVKIDAKDIAFIVVCVSIVSLIPVIGWLAGITLFFYLLMQATGCNFVDAVYVVLFSKLISFGAMVLLSGQFMQ